MLAGLATLSVDTLDLCKNGSYPRSVLHGKTPALTSSQSGRIWGSTAVASRKPPARCIVSPLPPPVHPHPLPPHALDLNEHFLFHGACAEISDYCRSGSLLTTNWSGEPPCHRGHTPLPPCICHHTSTASPPDHTPTGVPLRTPCKQLGSLGNMYYHQHTGMQHHHRQAPMCPIGPKH